MGIVQVWKCFLGRGDPIEVSKEWAGRSLNEITNTLPAGVYTTLRTYGRLQTICLEQHFARLDESIRILSGQLDIAELCLREKMRVAINYSNYPENRIRIQIPLNKQRPEAYLLIEELTLPTLEDYRDGVEVATCRMHRDHAEAKFTEFIHSADEIRKQQSARIHEVIMVGEDDTYLEGLSSNFYVVEQGRIHTAEENVLAGITRGIILDILKEEQFTVIFRGFSVERTSEMDEAFISSTSRSVLPVIKIDGNPVGSGIPGPITRALGTLFERKIQQLLELI